MANTTMTVTLKLAVKTTAEWAALGHAPAAGAPCVEITASGETKLKIGNGTDLFPALKYVSGDTLDAAAIISILGYTPADAAKLGKANGIATLDTTGKVPEAQLPSYVDDVVEGYYKVADGKFYKESTYTTEITGESGKIYIDLANNVEYRWTGSIFMEIPKSTTIGASTTNGNIVVNGSEVQVYDDKDCLKTDGYAGQLAKLFAATSYDAVPDDATLNDLSPGIYRVKTSAARVSLGIPDTAVSARPNNVSMDAMRRPGGLLIKLGNVVSGPTYSLDVGNTPQPFTGLLPSAFFIEAKGGLYYAYSTSKQKRTQTGTIATYNWSWRYILSAYVDSTTPLHITTITYLNTDVTVAAGTTHLFYKTKPTGPSSSYAIPLPYTSGTAYGPTASYTLTYDDNKGGLVYTAPSSGAVTLPAGQYLLALK